MHEEKSKWEVGQTAYWVDRKTGAPVYRVEVIDVIDYRRGRKVVCSKYEEWDVDYNCQRWGTRTKTRPNTYVLVQGEGYEELLEQRKKVYAISRRFSELVSEVPKKWRYCGDQPHGNADLDALFKHLNGIEAILSEESPGQ